MAHPPDPLMDVMDGIAIQGEDEASLPDGRLATRTGLERDLERLHPASFGWAMACCGWNRTEAEETLQSAYLKALDGRASFRGDSSTRTWFFGVLRRTAAERRRARRVRSAALLGWFHRSPRPEPAATPEGDTDRSESCRRVRRQLARLSPRQREMLHLVFYQEMTIQEAAEILRIPVGTARTHYERGKGRLRRLLAENTP